MAEYTPMRTPNQSASSRRQFNKAILGAAAAISVAGCANQGGSSPQARSPSIRDGSRANPSDTLRIAIIGVRGQGGHHTNVYSGMKDVEIVYLCDVDSNVIGPPMKTVEEKTGKRPQYVQDFRRVMADRSIDAISIATPNHWHSLLTIYGCQAGKDVYVEKPVSHNVFEGKKMVEAARKYERLVQAGTQSRSNPKIKDAIAYAKSGKLGKVLFAQGLCYKRRKSIGHREDELLPPVGVDYNLWLGPAPERPFNRNRFHYEWHWNWDYGNGDLGNQGIHQMDVARWAIGQGGFPDRAQSLGGRFAYVDDGQTPNTQVCWFDYGDVGLLFEVRGLKTKKTYDADVAVVVHCEDGYVVISADEKKLPTAHTWDTEQVALFDAKEPKDYSHQRNFVDAVKARKQSMLTAEINEGYVSTALCHLANISYRLGEEASFSNEEPFGPDHETPNEAFGRMKKHLEANKVKLADTRYKLGKDLAVNASGQDFFSDEKANELLTREYRRPFVVSNYV
jgi:predicted dehydrogenase